LKWFANAASPIATSMSSAAEEVLISYEGHR
jgi:hypothetical protein